jgi:hypothetical protein
LSTGRAHPVSGRRGQRRPILGAASRDPVSVHEPGPACGTAPPRRGRLCRRSTRWRVSWQRQNRYAEWWPLAGRGRGSSTSTFRSPRPPAADRDRAQAKTDLAEELQAGFAAARAGRTVVKLLVSRPSWSVEDRWVEAAAARQFDVDTSVALEVAYGKDPLPGPPSTASPILQPGSRPRASSPQLRLPATKCWSRHDPSSMIDHGILLSDSRGRRLRGAA